MTGNPYHEPQTAAAIWNVAMNGGLSRGNSRSLLDLIREVDLQGPISHTMIVRSLEVVLSRVKMNEAMRRDVMSALTRERGNAQRRAQYFGEWKGPGGQRHRYSPDIMAQGDCRVCGHTYEAHREAGAL